MTLFGSWTAGPRALQGQPISSRRRSQYSAVAVVAAVAAAVVVAVVAAAVAVEHACWRCFVE